jgi:hypothetical protein
MNELFANKNKIAISSSGTTSGLEKIPEQPYITKQSLGRAGTKELARNNS